MSKQHIGSLRGPELAPLAAGNSLVLAGRAGSPPTEQFVVAEPAMNNAVSAGGSEYVPAEMKSAQDKLSQARIATNDKEYDQARHLAQQAEWDARVAERKTQAAKAQKTVKDAQQGIMELREEGMRDTQH